MSQSHNKIFIILWFLLSWSLIVFSLYGAIINQIILKGLIPSVFILIIYIEKSNISLNFSLMMYILFVIWATMSVFYTVNMEMTLKYLQQLLGNILIWYCTFRLTNYISDKKMFFLILGSAFAFHVLLGVITPLEIVEKIGYGRASGLYTNSNALGFAMWYGVVITLFFFISKGKNYKKIFNIIMIVAFVWVLLSTGSRKSTFALLISVGFYLYFTAIKSFKRFIIIVPMVLIFLSFYNEFFREYIISNTAVGARLEFNNLERGTLTRTGLVGEGITFFINNPFFGIGLGSFTSFSKTGLMSHNDYIEILSSMGLIGLGLYLSIFVIFYNQSIFLVRIKKAYNYGVISIVFLSGYLVLGMGRPAFLDPVAILLFAAFQGYLQKDYLMVKHELKLDYENKKLKENESLSNN